MGNHPLAGDLDHILSRTEDLWENLRGQQLFMTGGTGFFGRWLMESFIWVNDHLDLKASMAVLTRSYDAFQRKAPRLAKHPAIRFCEGDVRSFVFPGGDFSHIIHAAPATHAQLTPYEPGAAFQTIVEGTRRTLDFAVHCGARKFLLTSSGAVYGKQPPEMTHIPEDYQGGPDCTAPESAYAEGKRAAELLCTLYAQTYGLETKIARCFSFVGSYMPFDGHYAIGNFIRDALQGGPFRVMGDGQPYRSYLYASDLAIWLWTILIQGKPCRPYNVGSEESLQIKDLPRVLNRLLGSNLEVKIAQFPRSDQTPPRYVPLTLRARSELGLRQYVGLEEALKRTLSLDSQGLGNHRTLSEQDQPRWKENPCSG